MSYQQKISCCLCRTPANDEGSKEDIEQLDFWVDRGKAWAIGMLGNRYKKGIGIPKDEQRAFELYTMAAEQEHVTAIFKLGVMYYNGRGTEPDQLKGKELLKKAATLGIAVAVLALKDIDKHEGRTTPLFTPTRTSCSYCGVAHAPPEVKLNPCSGCHSVFYCCKEHQIIDWKLPGVVNGHKMMCKKLQ